MSKRLIFALSPFILVGIGLVVGGFYSDDPTARIVLLSMGGGFVLLALLIIIGLSLAGSAQQKKANDLLATGMQGEAVVLSLEDTGMRVNDAPRVRMVLEVRIEGYPPYQVEKTLLIPLIRLPQVQVGSTIQVLADPNEPGNTDKVGLLLK